MDNSQFRRLLINTPKSQDGKSGTPAAARPSATPLLGSRKHSSIPMTPRQVGRNSVTSDFARQLAERNAKADPSKKKFRSAAPKGTKLAAGYTDRTKYRTDEEESETAQRIKNLEEVMKAGQIDRETFEKLVLEITGGDIRATHLVKGLDRNLLERVRKGEDVSGGTKEEEGGVSDPEADDAFDELAEKDIGPIVREKVEKKGEMAPPPALSGVKRSRDAILAQLKADRKAAAEAAAAEHQMKYPTLGEGFRKVTPRGETSRIEVDSKGREVLIITDAEGREKRKVRKQKVEAPVVEIRNDIDNEKKPINMHNVPAPNPEEDSEDEDIFEGVGSTYNPLAGLDNDDDDDDDSSSDEDGETKTSKLEMADPDESGEKERIPTATAQSNDEDIPDPGTERATSACGEDSTEEPSKSPVSSIPTKHMPPPPKRNYFKDPLPSALSTTSSADATVLAALAKVRTLDADSTLLNTPEELRLKKRAAELARNDRDMEDMDMDFGGSRFDDAAEMEREGEKVKLSEWRGLGAEGDDVEEGDKKRGEKRKRAPKKRKGDKNSATDVLMAMERQQKTKKVKTLG
ncbi:hypothetical protein K504DRAFT_474176 [Pleomassaria siparia CBS 279.74]|uniref:RED-like N-terminal domain-containing protein n=1 Tax=Pleomassaria siparia CBS 279.74 TaxID=1314801 RepID=A0A6G1JR63_9PLEO|nr:hypothetical protein K504DRAFT_474176 [Pleomassaria siparia CBS 279.74]